MKRFLMILLAVLLVTTAMAGCTEKPKEQQNDSTLPSVIASANTETGKHADQEGNEKTDPDAAKNNDGQPVQNSDVSPVTEPGLNQLPSEEPSEDEVLDSVVVEVTGNVGVGGN